MSEIIEQPVEASANPAAAAQATPADRERILGLGRPLAVPKGQGKEAWRLGARFDEAERAWFAPPGSDWDALKRFDPASQVVGFDRWGAIEKFEAAMMAAGLDAPALTEADLDGKWHRVPLRGKKTNNTDGAYKAEMTADGLHGLIRNYVDLERPIAFSERQWTDPHVFAALQAQQRQRQAERDAALREAQEAAARKAQSLWDRARERPIGGGLDYLRRKGLGDIGFGARFVAGGGFGGEGHRGALVIAAADVDGKVWSAQTIDAEGNKHFLKDGRMAGSLFWIGRPVDGQPIVVVEGFATGASARMALGHAVAVAFNAGNLRPVAEAIRARYPSSPLALLADNDREKEAQGKGNAGVAKASAAAQALGASWLAPTFTAPTPFSATDFNDLMVHEGLGAVREQCAEGLPHAFEPTQRARAMFASHGEGARDVVPLIPGAGVASDRDGMARPPASTPERAREPEMAR
jgi:putative DNA primase/helicase